MRISGIEDFNDGDILVIRTGPSQGFGESYEIMQNAKSMANASGFNPAFIVLPVGVSVEAHRDDLANWAAREGLGIRCSTINDVPEFVVGSNAKGVLGVSSNLTTALEQAYEECQK